MAGSLVINYLEQGTAASRPAAPTADTTTLSFYFATDTEVLSFYDWNDGAWQDVTTSSVPTAASTTEVLTGTDSAKFGTPDSIAALWEKGSDITSAGTISVGEGGFFHVTGTTTITDIDFGTTKAGRTVFLCFDGALTLTHNATTLILPTGANITTAAGDIAVFVSEGGDDVRCVVYQRKDGTALVGSGSVDYSWAWPTNIFPLVDGSGAQACKGTAFTPFENVTILSISAYLNTVAGATYRGAIYEINGSNIIQAVTADTSDVASPGTVTGSTLEFTFSSPVDLTAGTTYVFTARRTDGGDTYILPIYGLATTSTCYGAFPFKMESTSSAHRFMTLAKATPAISDTFSAGNGYWYIGVAWKFT